MPKTPALRGHSTSLREPLYFGCWQRPGHHLRTRDGRDVWRERDVLPWDRIDGALTPKGDRRQGAATIHRRGEENGLDHAWTALAWNDYTIDSRGGSNSVVFLPGFLTWDEALPLARESFPHIFERQPLDPFWAGTLAAAQRQKGAPDGR
jgi:hypothetical protein